MKNPDETEIDADETEIVSPEVREMVERLPSWDYYQREKRGDALNYGDL